MSYKNREVEPFVYVPCKHLPGMIAIPADELKPEEDNKEETC